VVPHLHGKKNGSSWKEREFLIGLQRRERRNTYKRTPPVLVVNQFLLKKASVD
jgi:hypothetical protein